MDMLDHIGFPVTDFARSKAFYARALAPLGDERPQFWIGTGKPLQGRLHVAFAAKTRAEVRTFYEAALAGGGIDNSAPGWRPHYHENCYGAFVLDPDGHNIEAMNHLPE